jgi:hypothetical protein
MRLRRNGRRGRGAHIDGNFAEMEVDCSGGKSVIEKTYEGTTHEEPRSREWQSPQVRSIP